MSGSKDNTIKVWNKDFTLLKTLDNLGGGDVTSLAITSDGLIIAGSYNALINIWNKNYQLLKSLT